MSSSTSPQLILATSANDIFIDPKAVINESGTASDASASVPDPSVCISSWESPLASKASLVVANVRLVIPLGAKVAEKIGGLQISLLCNEAMSFPSGFFESNQPFKDKITVDAATDFPISPGNSYVWDVPLLIPWTAACYERGRHARNYWHLTAKLHFPGFLFLNKTLSAEKNLFIFNAPMDLSALSYQHIHTGVADGLGALQMSFISNLFTAGGYLRGALLLPSPSPSVKIHAITMTMIQTVTLQSRKRHRHFEKCPDDRFEFFSLRGKDMEAALLHTGALCRARPAVGQEIELEWVARLPKDEQARPSTLPGGDTHIRLSHHLELSLLYDVDAANPVRDARGNVLHKRYRITWPVNLISCAVRAASWALPEYSAQDVDPVPKKGRDIWEGATEHETQDQCNCGDSLADVIEAEQLADYNANQLLREGLKLPGAPSTLRHRSRSRVPRRAASANTTPANGSSQLSGVGSDSDHRVGRADTRRRLGWTSGTSTPGASHAATSTPTSSGSRTPVTPRSRSRAITPDRISIEYESEHEGECGSGEHNDTWEEEDEEVLMDKLEMERMKREQLYDPNVGWRG